MKILKTSDFTFEQVKEILDTKKDYLIIDVREEVEYVLGHLKNAQLFPLGTITEESAKEIIPSYETGIIVYCKSGRRSNAAKELLSSYGYKNIIDIGGLLNWPYELEY